MATSFGIKQGALNPALEATLKKGDGTAQDLTGATVKFSMEHANGKIKVNEGACTIVDAPTGQVKYSWQTGDTDTPGTYRGEFHVTGLSGGEAIFPSEGYITVEVDERVA